MRTLGMRPCISMGEVKQLKIGLPFAFSELPKQSIFYAVKRIVRVVADIQHV
jgi:hypothetical protein